MRGVYTAEDAMATITTAKTVMYLTNAADMTLEIMSAWISNIDNDTNEQCEAALWRIQTIGTPTATSVTPTKMEKGDVASSVTAGANVTASEPTYFTAPDLSVGLAGFALLAGWKYQPVPEERMLVSPSESIGLRLLSNISSATELAVGIMFREMGG